MVFHSGENLNSAAGAGVLLDSWLVSTGPEQSRLLLEELFCQFIDPWLEQLTASALRRAGQREADPVDQAEEIRADVRLNLTAQLARLREPGQPPIRDLRAYTASMVYNACFLRLRARSPRRCQLQNRLRYVLRNDARFAIWEGPGGLIAGFARWAGVTRTAPLPPLRFTPADPAAFLEKTFEAAGAPVAFGGLVGLAVELWGGDDHSYTVLDESTHVSAQPLPEDTLQKREELRRLWEEVLTLPPSQRAALLLNLRDEAGQGVIELIPATGLATFQELAQSMQMSAEGLAAIWNDLPVDDAAIAAQLGITRQQVINLRKSARARLVRRLQGTSGNTGTDSSSSTLVAKTTQPGLKTAGTSLRTAGHSVRRLFRGREAE